MSVTPQPDPLARANIEETAEASRITAIAKCVTVGLAVGFLGLPLCWLGASFFWALRDLGVFLLLLLIPLGALGTWYVTRKYLARGTNCFRGAVAFASRYFFVGAGLGFFMTSCVCSVAFTTFFGGWIGIMVGSFGGAFQGWLDCKKQVCAKPNI